MKDFLNNKLQIRDDVIYINGRNFSIAKILGFSKDMLVLDDCGIEQFKKSPKKVIKHVIF